MEINTAAVRFDRRSLRRSGRSASGVALVGAVLLTLLGTGTVQAQCRRGGGGRTAPAGGGLAGVVSLNSGAASLGRMQQMRTLMQQQARFGRQQQTARFQQLQAFTARQRQAALSQRPSRRTGTRSRLTYVEAAQRRRATYLRIRRQQTIDGPSLAAADTDR